MTVGELIKMLSTRNHDAVVLMASDEEGNDYHHIYESQPLADSDDCPLVLWPCHGSVEIDEYLRENEDDE